MYLKWWIKCSDIVVLICAEIPLPSGLAFGASHLLQLLGWKFQAENRAEKSMCRGWSRFSIDPEVMKLLWLRTQRARIECNLIFGCGDWFSFVEWSLNTWTFSFRTCISSTLERWMCRRSFPSALQKGWKTRWGTASGEGNQGGHFGRWVSTSGFDENSWENVLLIWQKFLNSGGPLLRGLCIGGLPSKVPEVHSSWCWRSGGIPKWRLRGFQEVPEPRDSTKVSPVRLVGGIETSSWWRGLQQVLWIKVWTRCSGYQLSLFFLSDSFQ